MALDSLYVTAVDLQETFVDKDSGLPLAGGQIQFWVDGPIRTTPKLVYQLTGSPTNSQGGGYSYAPLGDSITLSNVGTIVDGNGNNIPLYYYPYDAAGAIQLYYIVVLNAEGVVQFTREAWPNTTPTGSDSGGGIAGVDNQVSNSQFVDVTLGTNNLRTFFYVGNDVSEFTVGAGWVLRVTHINDGALIVVRNPITGVSALQTNPPFTLSITPGSNISSMYLYQRFYNNPGLFGTTTIENSGWVSAGALLAPGSAVTIQYAPSVGPVQTITTANNTTLSAAYYSGNLKLTQSANTENGSIGYVDLRLVLAPAVTTTTISSVQFLATNSNAAVGYIQDSSNRQQDNLFHVYKQGLLDKPVESFLVGWDFPVNPAQFYGDSGSLVANNSSAYVWDQTIVYSSGNNAVAYSRSPYGSLRLTATADTQIALVQYLGKRDLQRILTQETSCMVLAGTTESLLAATVALYYTTSATLPDLSTGQSIVASLGTRGQVATTHGAWTEIPLTNNFDDNAFSIENQTVSNTFFAYPVGPWSSTSASAPANATYFAIVVGTGELAMGQSVDFNSISLVNSSYPTAPAPKTYAQTLAECQHYFWKTYEPSQAPAADVTVGMRGFPAMVVPNVGISTLYFGGSSFYVEYPTNMRTYPEFTFYAPVSGNEDYISLTLNFVSGGYPAGMGRLQVIDAPTNPGSGIKFSTMWEPVYPTPATGGTTTSTVGLQGAFFQASVSMDPLVWGIVNPGWAEGIFTYHCICDARFGIVL